MLETARRDSVGVSNHRSSSIASDVATSSWSEQEEFLSHHRCSSESLYRNDAAFSLRVVLKQAERLTRKDFFSSKSDPYCKLYLDDKKKSRVSSVKIRTVFPSWNERFDFGNVRMNQTLYIKVLDQNLVWKDSFLGMAVIPLRHYVPSTETFWNRTTISICKVVTKDLVGRPGKPDRISGCITVKLIFSPRCLFEETLPSARPSLDLTSRRLSSISSLDGSILGELAEGWEERRNIVGRPYYVHHPTRSIQWERPLRTSTNVSGTREIGLMDRSSDQFGRIQSQHSLFDSLLEDVVSTVESSSNPSGILPYNEEHGLPSLPVGWEMRVTQDGHVFFVDHNTQKTQWEDPRTDKPYTDSLNQLKRLGMTLGPLPAGWREKQTTNGHVYYVDHLEGRTQWNDPRSAMRSSASFEIPTYSRDFKQKLSYFKSHLKLAPGKMEIHIRRQNLFEDSFRAISRVQASDLRKRLFVIFDGEEGLDYGGVAREWFYFLSHEMFNPYYCLFEYSSNDTYTLQISPHSDVNPEHLQYLYFIGRVTGMALYHGKLLDTYFVSVFYKQMLNKDVTLKDIQSIDSDFYNSMTWLLENSVEGLELTFSVTVHRFGLTYQYELIPNGKQVIVTDQNKRDYVRLYTKWRATRGTSEQMKAFMKGFNDLISPQILGIFDERELEFLISGLTEIDLEDLHMNTIYKGYHEDDQIIQWFWTILSKFNHEQRARLLIFVTGTSRVPPTGFKDLQGSEGPRRFCIERAGSPSGLPRSHTCFNRLDLPEYENYQQLLEKLLFAIENTTGFAIE